MTRGFSILELVVVLAILAITALIAAPKYATSVSRFRVESAARRVQHDIELMRTRARATSAPRVIIFNTSSDIYRVSGEVGLDQSGDYTVDLSKAPYDCDLTVADFDGSTSLTFDGFGAVADVGRIVIKAGDLYRTIFVGTSEELIETGDQTVGVELLDLGGGATDSLR